MPLVHAGRPREEMQQVAIEEWMAASPVYSRRIAAGAAIRRRRCAPRSSRTSSSTSARRTTSWTSGRRSHDARARRVLARALRRARWTSSRWARSTCRACATRSRTPRSTRPPSPRTRAPRSGRCTGRPARRPTGSRTATGRSRSTTDADPVLAASRTWRVVEAARIAASRSTDPGGDAEPGGWADYSGEFDPDFELEDLSHRALVVALQEIAVQSHLLLRALVLRVRRRGGRRRSRGDRAAGAHRARRPHFATAVRRDGRRARHRRRDRDRQDPAVHPTFHPRRYVDFRVELVDDRARPLRVRPVADLRRGRRRHVARCARTATAAERTVRSIDRAGRRPAGPLRARRGAAATSDSPTKRSSTPCRARDRRARGVARRRSAPAPRSSSSRAAPSAPNPVVPQNCGGFNRSLQ